ncbi:UvrD-helicase domain-containing protein [candidate division KSB1 bacterium]|nr:UvrD-helicase domain-containing protein [candidate division KSB1 bacterium]
MIDRQKREAHNILRGLNTVQKQAVECTDGPSLVLAGAGSGKTRVLTHKVAYLIDRKKIPSSRILSLTFTNKAAREMRERILQLVNPCYGELWCSTFHSFFARILRMEAEKLGYTQNFTIYDTDDQAALIKKIQNGMTMTIEQCPINAIRSRISHLKNHLKLPEHAKESAVDYFDEHVAMIYQEYQDNLKAANAMDFDDLLLKPIELFHLFPESLAYYQKRWHYVLVDEYQDTNHPQYLLLKSLSEKHRNLTVVGDDDQSIYRWRGASLRNILEFEKDFKDCKTFRLEQNYRSTKNILHVANSIVMHNSSRMEKQLWTKNDDGELVSLLWNSTGEEESSRIIYKIKDEFQRNKRNFSDFAILYRTNAQSRAIEDELRLNGIAYVIVGGIRFYERKEIKDILAYLRAVVNPLDEISVRRVINFPARGIGNVTLKKIEDFCSQHSISFFEGLTRVAEIDSIAEPTMQKIRNFSDMILKYNSVQHTISAAELAATLVEELGILVKYKEEGSEEALERRDNIGELLTQIRQFSNENEGNGNSLAHFLEEVSLITDIDNWDNDSNAVTLMTLHSAKGLEFPVVFIAGIEEGLLPLSRNSNNLEDLEEERRLFYVGITRAREKLYLSLAERRIRYGDSSFGGPSRFLHEIKHDLLELDRTQVSVSRSQRSYSYDDNLPVYEKKAPAAKKLKPGIIVRHPRFGKGVVRRVEGTGKETKADILFEDVGEKKIVIKYANLEIL